MAIRKFLVVMVKRKASEWTDIEELMPLQFMWQTCSGRSQAKTYRASASSLVGSAQGATTTGKWPSKACSMPSLTSKGGRHLRDPLPALVVDLTHRGRPKLRLQQLEPLRGNRTEPNQPLIEAEKDPP